MKSVNKRIKLSWDTIILFLFTMYIISIYIFSTSSVTLIISEIIFCLLVGFIIIYLLRSKTIHLGMYFIFMCVFVLYSLLSSIWAINSSLSLQKAQTLTQLLMLSVFLFNYFYKSEKVEFIIKALYISGIVMSIYVLFYYGLNNYFVAMLSGERIGTEITNANTMGHYAGISVLICFYYALYNKNKINYFIAVLPFIIAMGTGSRKALILIVCGVLLLFAFNIKKGKNLKSLLGVITFVVLFVSIIQFPMFSVINERSQGLVNLIVGEGPVDSSSQVREQMIIAGWNQFKEDPIFGIGMGNSSYVTKSYMGEETYLHNNFIELLVNGGIIGFLLFYFIYAYILLKLIPMVKKKNGLAIITFVILLLQLALDYGKVSYYSKTTFLYFILGFLVISLSRKKNRLKG